MFAYILKRVLLMVPTLLGVLLMTFVIIQFAPGGPVEKIIAQLQGQDSNSTSRLGGGSGGDIGPDRPGCTGQPGCTLTRGQPFGGFRWVTHPKVWQIMRSSARTMP